MSDGDVRDKALEYILRELIDRLQADPSVCVDLSDLQNRFTDDRENTD